MSSDVPGIRPDLAVVTCNNCGRRLESKGNPGPAAYPHRRVSVDCSGCAVRATIISNEFGYFDSVMGDISVEDCREVTA